MGLDIIVLRAGLNRDNRSATIVADKVVNNDTKSGVFLLDPANEQLQKRWNDLFGKDSVSLRAAFKTALYAIRANNSSYMKPNVDIKKFDLLYSNGTGYKVTVNPSLSVTFRHNGSDPVCDAVTVNMITAAGKAFSFNIVAENAVPTFVQKALEYLNQEESLRAIPVPVVKAPVAQRHPVLPVGQAIVASNR